MQAAAGFEADMLVLTGKDTWSIEEKNLVNNISVGSLHTALHI